jgi:site-specific DNA-methyltransferase (adenine-specific)
VEDNLETLGSLSDESVGLIYLDPPFNSGRSYDLVGRSRQGQGAGRTAAFNDTFAWSDEAEQTLGALPSLVPSSVAELVQTLVRALGRRDMGAYLVMMAPRLVEMRRVLADDGSLYLHCDSAASHYLKILLDAIFGPANFRNEIVWKRTHAHSGSRRFGPVHDTILFYSKTSSYCWNQGYADYPAAYLERYYTHEDDRGKYQLITCTAPGDRQGTRAHYKWHGQLPPPGRHWAWKREQMEAFEGEGRLFYSGKGIPRLKRYSDDAPGVQLQDIWTDINRLDAHSDERVGFETQKPLALLERIILASSNPGDVVLDPFAGSGTAVVMAERLDRGWIGVDRSVLAGSIALARVRQEVDTQRVQLEGFPADRRTALRLLREEPVAFGLWGTSMMATLADRGDRDAAIMTGSGQMRIRKRQVQLFSWVPLQGVKLGSTPKIPRGRLSKVGFVLQPKRRGGSLRVALQRRLDVPLVDVELDELVERDSQRRGLAPCVVQAAATA